jgi:beta-lactamase regulating signal transducer with metallopeptidase domain
VIPISVSGSFLSLPAADWLSFLLTMAVKGLLVCALALLILALIRNSRAGVLSLIGTFTFAVMLLVPISLIDLQDQLIVVQVSEACDPTPRSSSEVVRQPADSVFLPDETPSHMALENAQSTPGRPGFAQLLIGAWLLGIALLGSKSILQQLVFRRTLGRSLTVEHCTDKSRVARLASLLAEVSGDLKLNRAISIRLLPGEQIPFVWGFRRPTLHLPAVALFWDEVRLRAVICHELAHLKRGDLYRLRLIDLVCIINWFNPLIWHLATKTKLTIERACDDYVLDSGTDCHAYARELLWFASQLGNGKSLAPTVPAMAKLSSLETRLVQILNQSRSRNRNGRTESRRRLAGTAILSALLLVPMATVSLVSKDIAASPCIEIVEQVDVLSETEQTNYSQADRDDKSGRRFYSRSAKPRYSGGNHAIHLAAIAGDMAEADRLLADDPGLLDIRNRDWMTPLALAAWHDQLPVVKQLINRGAALNVKNRNGLTPLFSALDRGRRSIASQLIASGADIKILGFRQRSPLHMAARAGDTKNAARLIQLGADINHKDSHGATPISLASRNRHGDVVELLLSHGAATEDIVPGRSLSGSKPRGELPALPR